MAIKILAVDDSPSIRGMVSFTLKSAGYDVVEAVDGVDGLEKAQQHDVSLILTDVNMPRMDGMAFVKSLRSLPRYKTAPILMLTTESSDVAKAQGRAAGATGWLVKPFDPSRLLDIVARVMR